MRRRYSAAVVIALVSLGFLTVVWGIGDSVISSQAEAQSESEPVRVLVLTGASNPSHDWRATTDQLERILGDRTKWIVDICEDPDHKVLASDEVLRYDVVLMNFVRTTRWAPEVEAGFQKFLSSGRGVVVVHAANNSFRDWPEFEQMVGAAWRAGSFHPPYGPFLVHVKRPEHPIMQGVHRFEVTDELYCNLREYPDQMQVLAYAYSPDSRRGGPPVEQPVVWTSEWQNGRVFHLTLGHDVAAMSNRHFVRLLQRGTLWAAGQLGGEVEVVSR